MYVKFGSTVGRRGPTSYEKGAIGSVDEIGKKYKRVRRVLKLHEQ